MREYELPARRVRKEVCAAEEAITERLLDKAELSRRARERLEEVRSRDALLACLDKLKPDMF